MKKTEDVEMLELNPDVIAKENTEIPNEARLNDLK